MKQVSVLVGAGSIGQAIIRRLSVSKHIVLADYSSIQYVFQLTAFLPLLGIVTYFLPNIKENDV